METPGCVGFSFFRRDNDTALRYCLKRDRQPLSSSFPELWDEAAPCQGVYLLTGV